MPISLSDRLEICRRCSWHRGEGLTMRCRVCGCFMKLKTALSWVHCPLRKW